MIKPKNATPPASVSPAKAGYKTKGLPATVEHRTPVRANVKTDDSANQRDPRPPIPRNVSQAEHLQRLNDQQLHRLKSFKHSRPIDQETAQYQRALTTYATCDDIKGWSPSESTEAP